MKLSTIRGEPGYHPQAHRFGIRVFVNGVHIEQALGFDEEEGRVAFAVLGRDGKLIMHNGQGVRETRRGTVTLEFRKLPRLQVERLLAEYQYAGSRSVMGATHG